LRQNKAVKIALQFPDTPVKTEEAAQAITEGAMLGSYSFRQHITKKPDYDDIKELVLVCPSTACTTA
jgi:leucyl aminopeptidase